MAIVGRVPGTEHFRNIDRHEVLTDSRVISLRVDESLYFANAAFVEDCIYKLIATHDEVKHIVLMCPAVNEIDLSALDVLEAINERLAELDITLHLSEVKGPVMDCLNKSSFPQTLTGEIFLSQHAAMEKLTGEAA